MQDITLFSLKVISSIDQFPCIEKRHWHQLIMSKMIWLSQTSLPMYPVHDNPKYNNPDHNSSECNDPKKVDELITNV